MSTMSKAKAWLETIDPGHDLARNIRAAMILAFGIGLDEGLKEAAEMMGRPLTGPGHAEADELRAEMDRQTRRYLNVCR